MNAALLSQPKCWLTRERSDEGAHQSASRSDRGGSVTDVEVVAGPGSVERPNYRKSPATRHPSGKLQRQRMSHDMQYRRIGERLLRGYLAPAPRRVRAGGLRVVNPHVEARQPLGSVAQQLVVDLATVTLALVVGVHRKLTEDVDRLVLVAHWETWQPRLYLLPSGGDVVARAAKGVANHVIAKPTAHHGEIAARGVQLN